MAETQEMAKKPKATHADDIFDDMHETKMTQLSSICPRFVPPKPTDWSRVGYGGNGTHPHSGLYAAPEKQYTTTNANYLKPLNYKPNQPVSRDCVSDAQVGVVAAKQRLKARKTRLRKNMATIMRNVKLQEQMQFMNEEQILKEKAHQMLTYFQVRPRPPPPPLFCRMVAVAAACAAL